MTGHIDDVKRHNASINPSATEAAIAFQKLTKKAIVQLKLKFRNVQYLCKIKGRPYVDYITMCELDEAKGLDIGSQYRTYNATVWFVYSRDRKGKKKNKKKGSEN